jgi:Spy/CpxP family protein refolding chaperone
MNHTLTATVFALLTVAAPAFAQTAECSDGSTSNSAHFQGTCSHHGGVAVWDNEEMKAESNQWCDDNPSLCERSH